MWITNMERERERKEKRGMNINFPPSFTFTRWGHCSWMCDLKQISWSSPPSVHFLCHVSKLSHMWIKPKPQRHILRELKWYAEKGVGESQWRPPHIAEIMAGDDTIHQWGHRLSEREWVLSWMNNYHKCASRGRGELYLPKPFHLLWSTLQI